MLERMFSNDWKPYTLYPLAIWINGLAFRNIQFSERGKPVIKISEIKNGITEKTARTESTFDEKYQVRSGDMLFAWSGSPDTSIGTSIWYGEEGWLNQHIFKVEPRELVDRRFFYYILKYFEPVFIEIARNKQTTGLGHVTVADLQKMEVRLPPLPIQKRIAEILGRLDDKIEVNRRINRTLEAMAQALYKHWFVDFGPFQDGPFVDSELGLIPEGWEVMRVEDLTELAYGKGLTQQNRVTGPFPVFGSSGVIDNHAKYLVEGPGIIVGRKGTIGSLHWAQENFWPIDTTYYVLPKRSVYSLEYIYHVLDNLNLHERNNDSAVPGLNRNETYGLQHVIVPADTVLRKFDELVKPWFSQTWAGEKETAKLASIRDYLLPKLLSGEVPVTAVEQMTKEVMP